ncbi:MAG: polymer-forming cytoskeletal protein [Actinomycetia bacterium]|nr:polymer-forming cytoskeletal protein [Actinomycetes bacterium]
MAFQGKDDIEGNDYPATGESRTLLTITGDSAKVEGKFTISKSIEIDCEVSGELEVDGELIIQKNGYVNADVKTINAQVIGKYEGNMEAAENVEIKETGEVSGNIKTDSLIINKGGIFSGNVTRISSEQPEPEPEPEPEPVDRDQEIDLEEPESDSEDLEL